MADTKRVEVTVGGRHSKTAMVLLWVVLALFGLAILGSLIGCGSCSDGTRTNPLGGGLLMNSSSYSACSRGCVKKDKRCDCSKQCPCWGEHKPK